MERDELDYLKKRFDYANWPTPVPGQEKLLIWQFFLSGSEFPGWQAHDIEAREQDGAPAVIQSLWKLAGHDTDALLRVEAYPCDSRNAAYDFLLRLLGRFQSPLIARHKDLNIGDVAFGAGEAVLVFARANLVVFLGNGGRRIMPIVEAARRFDEELVSKPATTTNRAVPVLQFYRKSAPPFQVGMPVPLDLHAADPLEKRVWFKIYTRLGEVVLKEEQPVYVAAAAGQEQLTVIAVTADQRCVREDWPLDVQ